MRRTAAPVLGMLLLGAFLLGALAPQLALLDPALLVGILGALLGVWGLERAAAAALPRVVHSPPVAARHHQRAQRRRAVPRQRDPDAAGHIRSRAPSGLLPAA